MPVTKRPNPSTWKIRQIGAKTALSMVLGLGAAGLMAEEAAPPVVPAQPDPAIEALIQKLKSDDPDERDAARRKLNAAGETIRGALEKALASAGQDADFTAQLRQIIKELGQNAILKRFEAPKAADFDFTDKPVKDVLEEFKKTYGWTVRAAAAVADKPCTFSIKGASYFQALEALRTAAKLGYRMPEDAGDEEPKPELPFELVELGEKGVVYAQPMGPLLVFSVATTMDRSHHTDHVLGTSTETLSLNWQGYLVAEPELPIGAIAVKRFRFADTKESKVTDLSVSLDDYSSGGDAKRARCFTFAAQGAPETAFAAPFDIKATVSTMVPLKMTSKRIELANAAGRTFNIKDGSLIFEKLHAEGGEWKVHFKTTGTVSELLGADAVPQADEDAEGSAYVNVLGTDHGENAEVPKKEPGVFFVDAQGKVIGSQGRSISGGNNAWTVVIDLPKEPAAIVLQAIEEKVEKKYDLLIKGFTMP